MKLNDLDPCLWQYEPPASSTTSGGGFSDVFPDLVVPHDGFAELKPLPPFEYSLGGSTTIVNCGVPPTLSLPPLHPGPPHGGGGGSTGSGSSSHSTTSSTSPHYDVSSTTTTLASPNLKSELAEYLLTSDIDDIAALIGSAIAEQQQQTTCLEPVTSSTLDPWTELDAWIQNAVSTDPIGGIGTTNTNTPTNNPNNNNLHHHHHPLGGGHGHHGHHGHHGAVPPGAIGGDIVQSSNNGHFNTHLPSLVTEYSYSSGGSNGSNNSSPILQARLQSSPTQLPESTSNSYGTTLKVEPGCYSLVEPHVSPTVTSTSARSMNNNSKNNNKPYGRTNSNEPKMKKRKKSSSIPMTIELGSDKEKPIHRCGICNRGFLNKSNIKVHLRTHTGEKPFKCEVCAKAFRQKAHLLKHVQIHKRITRD